MHIACRPRRFAPRAHADHPRDTAWLLWPRRALGARQAALAALDGGCPARRARRATLDLGVLAAFGLGLVLLTLGMVRRFELPGPPRDYAVILSAQLVLYALAAGWVTWRRPPARWTLAVVFLVALAARLAFVPQAPRASDDIYRYVWDGRIQAAGLNPYQYAPSDPALGPYRDAAIYPHINRKPVPTIYPPVAQAVFHLIYRLHPDSVAWTKLAFVGFDLATIAVIAGLLSRLGLRPERALLYAWHPLLILELAHSGHVEGVAVLFLLLALRARFAGRPLQAGALLACAALVKPYAVVALPALLRPERRRDLRLPLALAATAILAYLPFLSVGTKVLGYLPGYVQEEGIASGERYYLLQRAMQLAALWRMGRPHWLEDSPLGAFSAAQWYQLSLVGVMGALGLWCWLRPLASPRDIADRAALLFVALFALATPSQPWYTLLVLAFVPLVGKGLLLPASLVVGTAGFGYLHWWLPGWPTWPLDVDYGGRALALALIASGALLPALARRLPSPPPPPFPRPARAGRHAVPVTARSRGPVPVDSTGRPAGTEPASLFDRFPWLYAFCRERLFRDHTGPIVAALWPAGAPSAGSRLLELGCGPGFYARRLAARFRQLRVTGIDRSAAQLRRAHARAAAQQLTNCRFELADVRALPQPTDAVDAIVAARLVTILPEPERALAEMHRVLRPGGRCFLAEPRSRLWAAMPLRTLRLLGHLSAIRHGRTAYREPCHATVLDVGQFGALVRSQPWGRVRCWHDGQYHYAICEKGGDLADSGD